jgi:hypothetical protein
VVTGKCLPRNIKIYGLNDPYSEQWAANICFHIFHSW